mmetsp:Transcript_45235/g.143988  ORF Transcript_45235/g.143988 Transcript_45235/m.143988 type:complete len:169 (+) Transcript_45235:222-728(+)
MEELHGAVIIDATLDTYRQCAGCQGNLDAGDACRKCGQGAERVLVYKLLMVVAHGEVVRSTVAWDKVGRAVVGCSAAELRERAEGEDLGIMGRIQDALVGTHCTMRLQAARAGHTDQRVLEVALPPPGPIAPQIWRARRGGKAESGAGESSSLALGPESGRFYAVGKE